MADLVRGQGIEMNAHRGAAVALLRAMIARQAQGEDAVQQLVGDQLRACGAAVTQLVYDPASVPVVAEFASAIAADSGQRTSLVGTLAGGESGRSVILFAHPDAEPIRGTEHWVHDPFAGEIESGRLYGWGVADDLVGVAAAVSALTLIKASGIRLGGDVKFASTPSKRHARGVAALLHHGLSADGAIYLHPAESGVGMREIKAFASGQLEFTIDVVGRQPDTTEPSHTAFAHCAVNPLDKARVLMDALMALDAERGERVKAPLLEAAVGRSTNILLSSVQFGDHGALQRLPRTLSFGGAISFPPGETLEAVQAEVEAALEVVIAADDWLRDNRPVLTWVSGVTGAQVGAEHPLYQVVAQAITEATGTAPQVNPMHTSSDIRNPMVQKGIPTVGFGPFAGDLTHSGGTDEWVDVEDYLRFVEAIAKSLVAWCGVEPQSA